MGSGVKGLLIINVAAFFVSGMLDPKIQNLLVLQAYAVRPWQVITYQFLHANMSHLFFNMIGLYFFGTAVETVMGTKVFVRYYLFCGVIAAVAAYIFQNFTDMPLHVVGASGSLFGVFYACYRMFPNAQVFIMGIIPMQIRTALILFVAFDVISLFNTSSNIAHYSHLGGLLGGVMYYSVLRRIKIKRPVGASRPKTAKRGSNPFHRCAICGATDQSDPELEFRVCVVCDEDFCERHWSHPHGR